MKKVYELTIENIKNVPVKNVSISFTFGYPNLTYFFQASLLQDCLFFFSKLFGTQSFRFDYLNLNYCVPISNNFFNDFFIIFYT